MDISYQIIINVSARRYLKKPAGIIDSWLEKDTNGNFVGINISM